MSQFVVDTNIISLNFKGDTRASAYDDLLLGRSLVVSFMTLAELEYWAELHKWGERRRQQLEQLVRRYAVHYPDPAAIQLWGRVKTSAHRMGRPIDAADAWIAVTALRYNVPLVTHNPGDFAGVPGLEILTR
jgi:tRNA(fMet)-specific endonuclease VapC